MTSMHSNNRIKGLPLFGVVLIVVVSLSNLQRLDAFLPRQQHHRPTFGIPTSRIDVHRPSSNVLLRLLTTTTDDGTTTFTTDVGSSVPSLDDGDINHDDDGDTASARRQQETFLSPTVVRCPLKYLGPYPAIALRFPHLATRAQRSRNVTGISLDFVVDTAANLNTLNGQVATELQLEQVGEALPGIATSGPMAGGNTYMLGDTELERGWLMGTPVMNNATDQEESLDEERESNELPSRGKSNFLFMENLTASVMPVSSPASAGLLSLAFLYCFEGGVEFHWGKSPSRIMGVDQLNRDNVVAMKDGLISNVDDELDMPSVTFYGAIDDDLAEKSLEGMARVPIQPIPKTQLPSIIITINGVEIPALLDTGSPITVLNRQAAERAGIKTIDLPSQQGKSSNPFAAVANKFKEAQAISRAAANGDVLTIGGINGPINLLKSLSPVEISVTGETSGNDDDNDGASSPMESSIVSFGENSVFVGDIPGLQALNGIGIDASPAVVFGMDFLRQRPKMLLRAQQNEVYF